jgi:hypothetical protein
MLLGTDEEVGRAILANLAWGAAREAFGRADELAKMQPSHSSLSRADAARAEVARTSELFNEPWRRSAWARFSPTTSGSSPSIRRQRNGFANLCSE